MLKQWRIVNLIIAVAVLFYGSVQAGVNFSIVSDKDTIEIDETAHLQVFAEIDDNVNSGEGIISWQMAIEVNDLAVAEITDAELVFSSFFSGVDILGGKVTNAFYSADNESISDIGVNGPTEIFNFDVVGLSSGEVIFTPAELGVTEILSELVGDVQYTFADGDISVSGATIHVIPEPLTVSYLAIALGFCFRKRRTLKK